MSDALTDIARDGMRASKYENFIDCLIEFIQSPTNNNNKRVRSAAESCDDVPSGYWGSRTKLFKNIDEKLNLLLNRDRTSWLRLLRTINTDSQAYRKLKSLSPFKDELMLVTNYGFGFVSFDKPNELQDQIDAHLRQNDLCIYDGDKYAIIFEPIKIKEVIWLGSGAYDDCGSYETPKKTERSERSKRRTKK